MFLLNSTGDGLSRREVMVYTYNKVRASNMNQCSVFSWTAQSQLLFVLAVTITLRSGRQRCTRRAGRPRPAPREVCGEGRR